jgi:arylsulfatase A-like enzyme
MNPVPGVLTLGGIRTRVAAAALVLLAAAPSPSAPTVAAWAADVPRATAAARPNFVIIMTDDQDYASLGKMPQVNNLLVRRGVLFTNYVASIPLCAPSRTAHLTGRFGHNNGVSTNGLAPGRVLAEDRMLPVWLRRAGYTTGFFGKYLNFYGRASLPQVHVPPGWNNWNGIPYPWLLSYYDFSVNQNGTLRSFPKSDANYQTDVLTRGALAFIEAQRSSARPFYLHVSYLAPHGDDASLIELAFPAPRHQGRFVNEPLPQSFSSFNEADVSDKPSFIRFPLLTGEDIADVTSRHRNRLASLLSVDEGVRAIVSKLAEVGKLTTTYIVYLSDNGWHAGQHRFPWGKQGYYEESIRVPLVIRGPGVPQNVARTELAANIDVAPTIADLAGASPNATVDGRSLRPVLVGGGAWRTAMLIDGKILDPADGLHWFDAVRTDRYLYVAHSTSERELYDLKEDPHQIENVAAVPAYAGVRADLTSKLRTLKTCSGRRCWIAAPDRSPTRAAAERRTTPPPIDDPDRGVEAR